MCKRIISVVLIFGYVLWGYNLPGFYNISSDSTDPVFVVDKSRQMFYIFTSQGPGRLKVVDSIEASTGSSRGDKRVEGDKKTPEGVYTIVSKLTDRDLPEIYGPLALILDYPNHVDRALGNGGTNIWVHGRNEKLEPRQTKGCVSLENHRILEVNKKFVDLGKTKVLIYDSLARTDFSTYHARLKNWELVLQNWKQAWQTGKFNSYEKFYSPNFHSDQSLESYIERKERIDQNINWKKINTENVQVFSADYEARIVFEQEYITPDFISVGPKELTFVKNSHDWKIITEDYGPSDQRFDFQETIDEFLSQWTENNRKNINSGNQDTVPGKILINDLDTGLESEKVFAAFDLTFLNNQKIVEASNKAFLDFNNGNWTPIEENYKKQKEVSLKVFTGTFSENWVQSWNKGQMDEYLAHYSQDNFSTSSDNYQSFARRKKRLEQVYAWKDVNIDSLDYTVEGENIQIKFDQRYNCPRFFSKGQKSLVLSRESQGWKIITEDFTRGQRTNIRTALIQFVDEWQKAWESQQIDNYMQYYAQDFNSGEFDREGWEDDKASKFQATDKIEVKTYGYEVESDQKYTWEVSFKQDYNSTGYADSGNKLLIITGRPGNFKIIDEKWWQ